MKRITDEFFDQTLTTGAGGMVGNYIDFGTCTSRRSLDVTDLHETLSVFNRHKPKLVIHLAAETNVERCERDTTHAYNINSVGAYNVAFAAREVGAKMVYISTSAVFDGHKELPYIENDTPRPQGHYGHSKYLGELAVKGLIEDSLIIRISWVFGGGPTKDKKFVAKILSQMDQPAINCVSGTKGSPTYAKDLVAGIKKLVLEDKSGVFHLSNVGAPSRVEVAQEIVNIVGAKTKIRAVKPSFFSKTNITPPTNESMVSHEEYMRPWQPALKEYIKEEWSDILRTV